MLFIVRHEKKQAPPPSFGVGARALACILRALEVIALEFIGGSEYE
jgi:hypothetical protein